MNSWQNPSARTRFYRLLMGKYFQAVLYLHATRTKQTLPYLLETFKLFQIKIVPSPLKNFLTTRSNNAWRLTEFTPSFVTENKNISFICIQLAHALFQTSRLISSITKILSLTHRKCRSKPNKYMNTSSSFIHYLHKPIMQSVLVFFYIKTIQYSWDCIMLQWTEYPLF